MKEYDVNLCIITSYEITKEQIANLLGVHILNLNAREVNIGILWRLESNSKEDATLSMQINSILSQVHFNYEIYNSIIKFIKKIYLDIAVYYDTFTSSVSFSSSIIRQIISIYKDIDIEISSYPTED